MESVDRTLVATQNLLQALEKDRSLLNDAFFMQKLAYLRVKHKETSDFLARLQREPSTSHSCCSAICQLRDLPPPVSESISTRKPIARDARDVLNLAAKSRARKREELARARQQRASLAKDEGAVSENTNQKRPGEVPKKAVKRGILRSHTKNQSRSNPSVEIRDPSIANPSTSSEKQSIVSEPRPDPVPRTTVPVPFKFSTRKPIVNTFSTKFVEEMIATKKQEEEEEEAQGSKPKPFKAHAVPKSTYVPTNPRVTDQAYVEAIRRRLAGNLRKHFQQALLARKSKSMGDITGTTARPVPLSTYVPPSKLPEYRRARSAGHRAVKLLMEAKSPPNVKDHTIRTHVSTKIRHSQCAGKENHERLPRQPVPDFQKLHAELEEKKKKAPHMPVTIPRPFRLTSSETHLHRKCKSSSPPHWRSRNIRRVSRENIVVRPTHSSRIRLEAARKRQERFNMDRNRSERFWEEKRDEMLLNRLKVLSSIGSVGNLNEEIERKTAEKRRNTLETTRDYERYLAEMQQRIINRPLILERQSIIAQKQKFIRKYDERMASVGKGPIRSQSDLAKRHDSDLSAGTYSIKSKTEADAGEEYDSAEFENESGSSEKNKRSGSSISSSVGTSPTASHSKSSSSSNTKSSSSSKPKGLENGTS